MVTKEQKLRTRLKKIEDTVFKLLDRINDKMEGGEIPSDEEFRFVKKFTSLVKELDLMRKTSVDIVKKPITNEKLKDLIDHHEKFGIDKVKIMEAAGYYLCPRCKLFHKKPDKCIFKEVEG